jgi:hypothetical protein
MSTNQPPNNLNQKLMRKEMKNPKNFEQGFLTQGLGMIFPSPNL